MNVQPAVVGINWEMVGVMTGILSFVMVIIGSLILAATKSIFITKEEFRESEDQIEQLGNQFNKKLYDNKNLTIFMPREECEKCMTELKTLTASIVPREEWEKSKAYRERRVDANQRVVCGKIDKITASVIDMGKEQIKTNKSLNNLIGSFETYLDLTKKTIE